MELMDVWRIRNPDSRRFSWNAVRRGELTGSQIDIALTTPGISNCIDLVEYCYGYKTDHAMLKMKIICDQDKRGSGYWKFNKTLLHDPKFVHEINAIIDKTRIRCQGIDPDIRWERCKNDMTEYAKSLSIAKAKEKKAEWQGLLNKLKECEEEVVATNPNAIQTALIKQKEIMTQIEFFIEEKTKAAAFRSKAKYIKDNERNSKFFFALEKAKHEKKIMKQVLTEDMRLITRPHEIMREQAKFYTKLYASNPKVSFNLKYKEGPRLNENEREQIDSPVTIEELNKAVKQFKPNRTDGNDGLCAEFYQFFWAKMSDLYLQAINFAYETGKLHTSARRGVIVLIPKKKRDQRQLKSWHPLTMLLMCYKILAKVLANRIKEAYPELIHETQTGFLQSRQITTNIRTAIDIAIEGNSKIKGYLLNLDFHKCFDKIEYSAILGSLEYLGFGPQYRKWVNLLLEEFQSCTSNNGFFSEYFQVTRSYHQGCPLAPLLYLACGEVLSREIRQNAGIHGIKYRDLEILITQFADDTQLFLDSKESVEKAIETLQSIETNIGLTINYEKSCIYSIGGAPKFESSQELVWDPGGLCILGIETLTSTEDNYTAIVEKSEKICQGWYN